MLTAERTRTSRHEAAHLAMALMLDLEVLKVERRSTGNRHGLVLIAGGSDAERQAFLLCPMLEQLDATGFNVGSHAVDYIKAKEIDGDLTAAIVLAKHVMKQPHFRALLYAAWNRLDTKTVLDADDIEEIRNA